MPGEVWVITTSLDPYMWVVVLLCMDSTQKPSLSGQVRVMYTIVVLGVVRVVNHEYVAY